MGVEEVGEHEENLWQQTKHAKLYTYADLL